METLRTLPRGSCAIVSKNGKQASEFVRHLLCGGGSVVLVSSDSWPYEESSRLRVIEYGKWGRDRERTRYVRSGDITSLGVKVHQCLCDLRQENNDVYLCVDTLPHMSTEVDREMLYRFLHIISTKLKTLEGMGFFMLDQPTSPATMGVVRGLSDVCLQIKDLNGRLGLAQVTPAQIVRT